MDLSIIILNYNTKNLVVACIESIIKYVNKVKYEIIVIDNASSDGSVEKLKSFVNKYKFITLIVNRNNLGFSKANNQGIKKAGGKFILLLNSDTLFKENFIYQMINWLIRNPDVGVASCALLSPDGSIQGNGGYFPTLTRVFSWMIIQDLPLVDLIIKPFHPLKSKSFSKNKHFFKKRKELDWVTGAFFMFRKTITDEIGFLDEDYFMYTEEVDYCYRIKSKGYKIVYNPSWSIYHIGGASAGSLFSVVQEIHGIKIFYRKHYSSWQYPILLVLLKVGMFGRMLIFGTIEGKNGWDIYRKALTNV